MFGKTSITCLKLFLVLVNAERTVLDHEGHDLVESVGGGHGGELGVGVVGRGNLDDIGSDEVDALETADDGAELTGAPATGLGGTGSRGKGRVKGVNVNGEVDGVLVAYKIVRIGVVGIKAEGLSLTDTLVDLLDDALGANGVDLASLDNLESNVTVVVVVGETGQGSADTGVDVGVVAHQTLHGGVVEVSTVVNGGDL